jgi:ABC-type bacteriocin/lantibiotic exporter with double-glycine peptidase domain
MRNINIIYADTAKIPSINSILSALVNSIVILLFMWIGTSLFRSPELA